MFPLIKYKDEVFSELRLVHQCGVPLHALVTIFSWSWAMREVVKAALRPLQISSFQGRKENTSGSRSGRERVWSTVSDGAISPRRSERASGVHALRVSWGWKNTQQHAWLHRVQPVWAAVIERSNWLMCSMCDAQRGRTQAAVHK